MRGSYARVGGALLGAVVVVGAAGAAVPAFAQPVLSPAGVEREDAELFQPVPDLGHFLTLHDSDVLYPGRFSVSGFTVYSNDSLSGRRTVLGDEHFEPIVDGLATFHLLGAVGVLDSVQVGMRLPLYWVDESSVRIGSRTTGGSEFGLGDVELSGKVQLAGIAADAVEGLGAAIVPRLSLPTGDLGSYRGTGDVGFGGDFVLDYKMNAWRFGANFGGRVRDGFGGREDDDLEDQFTWGVGVHYALAPRTSLVFESYGRTDAGDPFGDEFRSPVEAVVAGRFPVGPVDLTIGGGGGLNDGKNASQFRVFAGLSAPREARAPALPALASSRLSYVVEDHDRNGQVSPGDVIVYSAIVTNDGGRPAEDVVVMSPIPASTEYLPGTITLDDVPVPDSDGYVAVDPERVEVVIASLSNEPGRNTAVVSHKVRIDPALARPSTIRGETRLSTSRVPLLILDPVETPVFPATVRTERAIRTGDAIEVTERIQFELDSARLRTESLPVLDDVATILRANPQVQVDVVGHTDSQGDADYNLHLSESRADAVKAYLVAQGVAASRMRAIGRGETEPILSNDTPAGRAANRRVEFRIRR